VRLIVRLIVLVLMVLLAGAGVGAAAGCGATAEAPSASGDAELSAIKVPADWTLTSSQFEPGGYRDPDRHWLRWYKTPASAVDALAAYDQTVRAAGWQADTGCPLESGHGCWLKGRYHLTASAGEGTGCHPGDQVCAVIEVKLTAR